MNGTYPEVLSAARFDQHFKNARQASFDEIKKASEWLREHQQFQIYTEVEGDNNEYYMDKGFRFVNRTGYYVCVFDSRYIAMKYTGMEIPNNDVKFNKIIQEELI